MLNHCVEYKSERSIATQCDSYYVPHREGEEMNKKYIEQTAKRLLLNS